MATLSTELLKSHVVQTLPDSVQYNSVLTDAGANNISYGVNSIRSVSMGAGSVVDEGGVKPVSNVALDDTDVVHSKIVIPFIVTEEFDESEEGSEVVLDLIAQASKTLVKSIDIAILNGTNPSTGVAVAKFSDFNLKDNATDQGISSTLDDALYEVLTASPMTERILLSRDGFGQIANLRTGGFRNYPDAKTNGEWFGFGTANARLAQVLGLDGFTEDSQFENTTLALAGDFSRIGRSYGKTVVRVAREGTIGGENLLETNKVAYIFEQFFSFYVKGPDAFTIVKTS